jgi:hypothetical protein
MTALEQARATAETLRATGIRTSAPHLHVGENGTRCEFCGKPLWVERHDPINVRAGRIRSRATDRTNEDKE